MNNFDHDDDLRIGKYHYFPLLEDDAFPFMQDEKNQMKFDDFAFEPVNMYPEATIYNYENDMNCDCFETHKKN